MSNEKMISTIILTNGHEERLKSSIDSILSTKIIRIKN